MADSMPVILDSFDAVTDIKSGFYHCYAYTVKNEHFLYGRNTGNICLQSRYNKEYSSLPNMLATDIKNVFLGNKCTFFTK